jgi:hypothetical protein
VNKHNRKITNIVSAFLLIVVLYSCVSTKPLYIEIPQKSKKELPENIQSLLLIARMVDDSYTNLDTDSLQKIFYHHQFNYDTIINDIQTVDTTLKALGELLFESGRYDFVIPENRFPESKKTAFITSEMPWDEVKALCDTFDTDAILSLDYFKTRVTTKYQKENFFQSGNNSFYALSQAQMKINYEALFRVYDPVRERIIYREFMRDTIIWEDEDSSTQELFTRFRPVKNALTEAGIAIALDLSGEISSNWFTEKRSYFAKGDSNLKQAAQLLNAGEWVPAIALWKDTAEKTKSKSIKSKAEFNIALGYEMLGDLDSAVEWALKSYNTMYRTNTYNYLEILKRRKNDINNQ